MRNNKGVTLIELIVVVALILVAIPIYWYYINMSVKDNATLNDKVAVQTSVNTLMNQLQRDIQEARNPINPNTNNYTDIGDDGFLICKPEASDGKYQSVLYKFNDTTHTVTGTYNLKLSIEVGEDIDILDNTNDSPDMYVSEYNYINDISLTKDGETGIKVMIDGEIKDKSHYKLSNTYYTRNTIF